MGAPSPIRKWIENVLRNGVPRVEAEEIEATGSMRLPDSFSDE